MKKILLACNLKIKLIEGNDVSLTPMQLLQRKYEALVGTDKP